MRAAMAAVMAEAVKDVADVADGMAPAMVRATPPAKAAPAETNAALKGVHPAMATAAPKAKTATARRVKAATAVAVVTLKTAAMPH